MAIATATAATAAAGGRTTVQGNDVSLHVATRRTLVTRQYSGTSLLRSPTGLDKSDLNGEVTILQGVHCTVEYNLGLSKGDRNGEVTLLVR